MMSRTDAILATGISYRQLDHWVRRGWLRPGNANAGSGTTRLWPDSEFRVAVLMGRMVAAGLPVQVAHQVARAGGRAALAPAVSVFASVEDPPKETGTGWPT